MKDRIVPRHQLMRQLAALREQLRAFGIRDASDYAEVLVAEALGGARENNRITKGFDIVAPKLGRVEVKCRQLPFDGRVEERVQVGGSKGGGFEHLAIVIFRPDFAVKGAVVVPYAAVWALVRKQRYGRIAYSQARRLAGAVDITTAVRAAAEQTGTSSYRRLERPGKRGHDSGRFGVVPAAQPRRYANKLEDTGKMR